jgi:hypothetical protein
MAARMMSRKKPVRRERRVKPPTVRMRLIIAFPPAGKRLLGLRKRMAADRPRRY